MNVHRAIVDTAPLARPLELGFLSPHNPYDRRNFSGTPYFALQALLNRTSLNTRVLGHRPRRLIDRVMRKPAPSLLPEDLDLDGLDAVVGLVASPLLDALADHRPDLPLLHVTDATPQFLRDAYGWRVPDEADACETRLAARAAGVIYSSDQLAERAPKDLGLPGLWAHSVPFGVNIDAPQDLRRPKPALDRINLLFVGLDWERKGGDIAVEALEQLRIKGCNAVLTIVGRCPDRHRNHPHIRYAGFLNKNRARDAEKLNRLYQEAHLLVLPSRADCSPMVVAEALSRGTPVVAADTGGIATLLGNGGAGRLLPQFSSPDDWAKAIREMTADREAYEFMSDAGHDRALTQLSWGNWAWRIESLAFQAVQPQHADSGLKVAAAS